MKETSNELTDSQKILVAAIVQALRKDRPIVRLWVWIKKVLSFASSEADKIHLD